MHALSSQMVGSSTSSRAAHAINAAYLAPGASSSSRQLCEKKASTDPSVAFFDFPASSSAVVAAGRAPGVADGPTRPESARSAAHIDETGMQRKSSTAFASSFAGSPLPHIAATAAASSASLPPLPPSLPSRRCTRSRFAGVAIRLHTTQTTQKMLMPMASASYARCLAA